MTQRQAIIDTDLAFAAESDTYADGDIIGNGESAAGILDVGTYDTSIAAAGTFPRDGLLGIVTMDCNTVGITTTNEAIIWLQGSSIANFASDIQNLGAVSIGGPTRASGNSTVDVAAGAGIHRIYFSNAVTSGNDGATPTSNLVTSYRYLRLVVDVIAGANPVIDSAYLSIMPSA